MPVNALLTYKLEKFLLQFFIVPLLFPGLSKPCEYLKMGMKNTDWKKEDACFLWALLPACP